MPDTLTAQPPDVIARAESLVTALGFTVRTAAPREGYLETRWFDVRSRRSRSMVRDADATIRVRVYADLVTPTRTEVTVETVHRRSLDPSVPERVDELVVAAGTPGDSLTQAVRKALKEGFGDKQGP